MKFYSVVSINTSFRLTFTDLHFLIDDKVVNLTVYGVLCTVLAVANTFYLTGIKHRGQQLKIINIVEAQIYRD